MTLSPSSIKMFRRKSSLKFANSAYLIKVKSACFVDLINDDHKTNNAKETEVNNIFL